MRWWVWLVWPRYEIKAWRDGGYYAFCPRAQCNYWQIEGSRRALTRDISHHFRRECWR